MLATRVVVAACELEGAPEVVAFSVEVCCPLVVLASGHKGHIFPN